jgi:hypothetical protein
MLTTQRQPHRGYEDCVRLENDHVRVILGHVSGGRVLEYSHGGVNALYVDRDQDGWRYAPEKAGIEPDSGRFDIGPETVIPRHPELWLGSWTVERAEAGTARLVSVKDQPTGVQLVRNFTLDPNSPKLTCAQIIRNVSDRTVSRCHWSRTFATGGGVCLIPLSEESRFPRHYLMYEPPALMNFLPEDPNIRIRNGILEIIGTPRHSKQGFDSAEGCIAYLTRDHLLFVKRFPVYPDRVYNEMAGLTISIWYYQNRICEIEPIGPAERLAPRQEASFTETWWLFPWRFPDNPAAVDSAAVMDFVDKNAR